MIQEAQQFLLSIGIDPIRSLMQFLLEVFQVATGNYGVAIILLSVAINTVLLPLTYLAEELREKHRRKVAELKPSVDLLNKAYRKTERYLYTKALYRVYGYRPVQELQSLFGVFLQIPVFIAAYLFLRYHQPLQGIAFFFIDDLSRPDGLLFGINLLPLVMFGVNTLHVALLARRLTSGDRYRLLAVAAVFLILLYNQPSALLLYWTVGNFYSLVQSLLDNRYREHWVKRWCVALNRFLARVTLNNPLFRRMCSDLYVQAALFGTGALFIYHAIPMAASDTSIYDMPYSQVVGFLLVMWILAILLLVGLKKVLPSAVSKYLTIAVVFGALVAMCSGFLFPGQVPLITTLGIPPFAWSPLRVEIAITIVIVISFVVFCVFFDRLRRLCLLTLLFANVFLSLNAISRGLDPSSSENVQKESDYSRLLERSDDLTTLYTFSQKSNVVVIFLDMFQGGIFSDLLANTPRLKSVFDGFVFYPNTLAHGINTWISASAMAGGPDFQVQNASEALKRNYVKYNYVDSFNGHIAGMKLAQKWGFDYAARYLPYTDCSRITYGVCLLQRDVQLDAEELKTLNLGAKSTRYNHVGSLNVVAFFTEMGLLLSLPSGVRESVGGRMAGFFPLGEGGFVSQFIEFAALRDLSDLLRVDPSSPGTFKYFYNKITHTPWVLNEHCDVVPENVREYRGLYLASYCSVLKLERFFQTLKSKGIYDVSKIIIVSDHGRWSVKSKRNSVPFNDAHALLLVKDFNVRGPLVESMQLMSNYDTYGIAQSGVSGGREDALDPIKNPPVDRSLIFVKGTTPPYSYNISEMYEVRDNVFEEKNWKRIK